MILLVEVKSRVHQCCFQVWVVLLHGVSSIVQHKCSQRIKLIGWSKPIATTWVLEHWDTLEFASVTAIETKKAEILKLYKQLLQTSINYSLTL